MTRDELQAWINTLRLMLERGELAVEVEPIVRSRLRAVDFWQTRPAKKRRASSNEVKRALAADLVMLHAHLVEGNPRLPRRWPT